MLRRNTNEQNLVCIQTEKGEVGNCINKNLNSSYPTVAKYVLIHTRNSSSSPVSLFQRNQTALKFRCFWEKGDKVCNMCTSEFFFSSVKK